MPDSRISKGNLDFNGWFFFNTFRANVDDDSTAARVTALSAEQKFAIAHDAYHLTMAGSVASARICFVDFNRLYWMVAVGVAESQRTSVLRVTGDANALVATLKLSSCERYWIYLLMRSCSIQDSSLGRPWGGVEYPGGARLLQLRQRRLVGACRVSGRLRLQSR